MVQRGERAPSREKFRNTLQLPDNFQPFHVNFIGAVPLFFHFTVQSDLAARSHAAAAEQLVVDFRDDGSGQVLKTVRVLADLFRNDSGEDAGGIIAGLFHIGGPGDVRVLRLGGA